MDRFEEFIVKKYPNRSPKVLLQKLQDIDETWFYAVKEVQDQSEVWQLKQAEIDEKDKRIENISLLVISLRNEFDLHGGGDQVERQIELLEEALRGECE